MTNLNIEHGPPTKRAAWLDADLYEVQFAPDLSRHEALQALDKARGFQLRRGDALLDQLDAEASIEQAKDAIATYILQEAGRVSPISNAIAVYVMAKSDPPTTD